MAVTSKVRPPGSTEVCCLRRLLSWRACGKPFKSCNKLGFTSRFCYLKDQTLKCHSHVSEELLSVLECPAQTGSLSPASFKALTKLLPSVHYAPTAATAHKLCVTKPCWSPARPCQDTSLAQSILYASTCPVTWPSIDVLHSCIPYWF